MIALRAMAAFTTSQAFGSGWSTSRLPGSRRAPHPRIHFRHPLSPITIFSRSARSCYWSSDLISSATPRVPAR